jgi:FkbM family methyltransferase
MGKAATRQVNIAWRNGEFPFQCYDNPGSITVSREIFAGNTYKPVPSVRDVRLVVDIGANIGAAAIFFHTQYPGARIVAIEPSSAAFDLLARNTAQFPAIQTHRTALYDRKARMPLHVGNMDSITNSFGNSVLAGSRSELLELEEARAFFEREGLTRADILKLDTEGCEWPILTSLQPWLGNFRVIYLEYHSENDRQRIDALLAPTHLLYNGQAHHLHRGEFCYVARSALSPADERMEIKPPAV